MNMSDLKKHHKFVAYYYKNIWYEHENRAQVNEFFKKIRILLKEHITFSKKHEKLS